MDDTIKQQIYEICKREDDTKCGQIHATLFSDVLKRCGLEGEKLNMILNVVEISNEGWVSYEALQQCYAPQTPSKPKNPHVPSGTPNYRTFERDLFSPVHMPFLRSQDGNLQINSTDLHKIFHDFDSGMTNHMQLMDALDNVGIPATPELQRLVRQNEFTFRQFISALNEGVCNMDIAAGVHNPNLEASEPKDRVFGQSEDYDDFQFSGRKLGARPTDTQNLTKWSYNAPESKRISENGGSKGRFVPVDESGGVKGAVSGHIRRPTTSWETETQAACASGAGLPTPADVTRREQKISIKEKVHKCIRELDQGFLNVTSFRRMMYEFGIEIPCEVDRLLEQTRSHGRANFITFARAFEPYFQTLAMGMDEVPLTEEENVPVFESDASFVPKEVPPALKGSGNIICWPTPENTQLSSMPEAAAKRQAETLYSGRNILRWGEEDVPDNIFGTRRGRVSSALNNTSSNLHWPLENQHPPQPKTPLNRLKTPFGTDYDIESHSAALPFDVETKIPHEKPSNSLQKINCPFDRE
eukprot:TRINITY_DN1598_c0_g1_i1.p1 TRINITY_DN1598_c0_g1~~TRINITY_DN1598_c0_g1_i1.p1  ORF type:complete len:542 (+),score=122.60 TRINITY_DN1598_c0_g1_i1:45-1628(+)